MEFLRSNTDTLVGLLSFLTVIGDVAALVLLSMLALKRDNRLTRWVEKNGLVPMLILALVATGGSLFFSEIIGWVPCKDCWFERIFMYPQTILLAIAVWRKDRGIVPYVMALCAIGSLFSIGQYWAQVTTALQASTAQSCDASGISCAATQVDFAFGYVTIPVMALTVFVLNAIGSLYVLRGLGKGQK
jgi:disulfide bond formation protein DsbB